ncbi:MAG: DUF4147 domain-containing protein [Eubacteriales bacterium]|nr:DUF4147 domain-containing protein [Eubacteriales bacterium]
MQIREEAQEIIREILRDVRPEKAVAEALREELERERTETFLVAAVGKAAWEMAAAAQKMLGSRIRRGVVLTKYGHGRGELAGFSCMEAGHPVPDENSVKGAREICELFRSAGKGERILLLLSGGGSALMELPEEGLTLEDIREVTRALLSCGASIQEINRIRKRLSAVKGGKLAALCGNTPILQIVLSDVVGDDLGMIASGPACEDRTTNEEIRRITDRYGLRFGDCVERQLYRESPRRLTNVTTRIVGNVRGLCLSAAKHAAARGYAPLLLTDCMGGEAREAGQMAAAMLHTIRSGAAAAYSVKPPCALILGGETVVTLRGTGTGGRNQELALSAALAMEEMEEWTEQESGRDGKIVEKSGEDFRERETAEAVIFSLGSDGTDGPTDAAGGMVDYGSAARMRAAGIDPAQSLQNNDAYHALQASGDLLITGPTGTNVNDVTVILCR